MAANQQQNLSYRFTQDSFGTHIIQDKSGNKITIDCRTLTMSDIPIGFEPMTYGLEIRLSLYKLLFYNDLQACFLA